MSVHFMRKSRMENETNREGPKTTATHSYCNTVNPEKLTKNNGKTIR